MAQSGCPTMKSPCPHSHILHPHLTQHSSVRAPVSPGESRLEGYKIFYPGETSAARPRAHSWLCPPESGRRVWGPIGEVGDLAWASPTQIKCPPAVHSLGPQRVGCPLRALLIPGVQVSVPSVRHAEDGGWLRRLQSCMWAASVPSLAPQGP